MMAVSTVFVWLLMIYSHCKATTPWKEVGWGKLDNGKVRAFTKEEIKAYIKAGIFCPCGNKKIQACGNKWFGGCGPGKNWENECPAKELNDFNEQHCNNGCFIHDWHSSCHSWWNPWTGIRSTVGAPITMNVGVGKCHAGSTCIVIDDETVETLHKNKMYIHITGERKKNYKKKLVFNPEKTQLNKRKLCWPARLDTFMMKLMDNKGAILKTFDMESIPTDSSIRKLSYKSINITFQCYRFYGYADNVEEIPLPFGGTCLPFNNHVDDKQQAIVLYEVAASVSIFIIVIFCSIGFLCGGFLGYFVANVTQK